MPILSKTAKLIVALILTANLLLFVFSVSYSWSGLIPLLASIGGEIVFLGLWIEKEADEEAKKEEELPSPLRLKANIGWWLLMAGIFAEVLFGAGLASYDVYGTAKVMAIELRLKPRTITEQNRKIFIDSLTNAPKSDLISVFAFVKDIETETYTAEIKQMLIDAGFKFNGDRDRIIQSTPNFSIDYNFAENKHPEEIPEGYSIFLIWRKSAPLNTNDEPVFVKSISKAFENAGIKYVDIAGAGALEPKPGELIIGIAEKIK